MPDLCIKLPNEIVSLFRQCHTDQVVVQRPLGHRPAQPPPHPRRPQVRLRRQVRALQEPALPLMRGMSVHVSKISRWPNTCQQRQPQVMRRSQRVYEMGLSLDRQISQS